MPEDDGAVPNAGEHLLVVGARLAREALDIGERRAVDVEHAVDLRVSWQVVEALDLVGEIAGHELHRRHDLRDILRRLGQPALAVPANPGGVLELAQARECRASERFGRIVVATEQVPVRPGLSRLPQHLLERRQVPVDVVEDGQERHESGA